MGARAQVKLKVKRPNWPSNVDTPNSAHMELMPEL